MKGLLKETPNYKSNFLLLVSMACLLPSLIHSNCPYLLSKVPFCKERSFNVNRGPNSFNLAFLPSESKPYLKKKPLKPPKKLQILKLPVMAEKNVISLIMKSNGALPYKFRIIMEQSTQHSAYTQTQSGCKIV